MGDKSEINDGETAVDMTIFSAQVACLEHLRRKRTRMYLQPHPSTAAVFKRALNDDEDDDWDDKVCACTNCNAVNCGILKRCYRCKVRLL